MPIQTINPYTNLHIKSYEAFSSVQLDQAVVNADAAYQYWKKVPISERAQLMRNLANILQANADHYAQLMTLEMGKLFREAKNWEVNICIEIANYYADHAQQLLDKEPLKGLSTGDAYIEKHPIGALLGIMPWNYPFYQVFRFVCPNIMAGNVCLVKHASNVPQCAQAIESLFEQAGFPKGVYTNIFARGQAASDLIAHDKIKGVSFTGSEQAGAQVAQKAGLHLKKVVLELGGSDPFIVLKDADLDYTVDMALLAKMFNNGQTCVAAKRFIVVQEVYDEFLERFKTGMSTFQAGDPMLETTTLAPMSSEAEVQHLLNIINEAVAQGAQLVVGGQKENLQGAWLQPTILTGVNKSMRAGREELFGPVAVVYKAKDEQEAIQIANDTPYGLGSCIFSKDTDKAQALASELETGMTFINSPTTSEPSLPFGGTKRSGFGRELSHLGIDEFVNKKLIRTIPNYLIKMKSFLNKIGIQL